MGVSLIALEVAQTVSTTLPSPAHRNLSTKAVEWTILSIVFTNSRVINWETMVVEQAAQLLSRE